MMFCRFELTNRLIQTDVSLTTVTIRPLSERRRNHDSLVNSLTLYVKLTLLSLAGTY